MQAAIDGTYKFPKGVNLFPGISCMFECSFCGRNYDARHPKYNYFYERLLDQDPKDNPYRYNISGGLEPLTYHEIDRLCKDLYDRGFKSRLVTNGFLLTKKNIEKKPNLLTLDHIRVSLYGYTKEQTYLTTKHPKGYDVVKENLTDYNKLTNKPPTNQPTNQTNKQTTKQTNTQTSKHTNNTHSPLHLLFHLGPLEQNWC